MTKRTAFAAAVVVVILIWVVWYSLANRGYGKLTNESYQVATALYGACLAQSTERVSAAATIVSKFENNVETAIPQREIQWLNQIIDRAERGHWTKAARMAKQMMEDQVEY